MVNLAKSGVRAVTDNRHTLSKILERGEMHQAATNVENRANILRRAIWAYADNKIDSDMLRECVKTDIARIRTLCDELELAVKTH